jgi:uncharacterized membrane protein YwaF
MYFIFLGLLLVFLVASLWLLKGKSDDFKKRYISALLFFSLIVHFCKLLFEPYVNDEWAIRKITPENICALSTLIFPFIFLSQNKVLKDYMFYVGVISGTLAVLFPLEALGKNPLIFDTIRFYLCHIIITVAPFLMVATGLHKLDYHRIYKVPIGFLLVMCIILLNEIVLQEIGLVPMRSGDLFETGFRNFSMIFGVNYNVKGLEGLLNFFTPQVFMKIPFGPYAGQMKYWPIIWAIIPVFVFVGGLSLLLSIYWEKDHMKEDLIKVKNYFVKNFSFKKHN